MSTATTSPTQSPHAAIPHYVLAADGAYCIEHYDSAPAFSSFLPGIAGFDGVPLWCLYVNRGQAIASFGVNNKDNAIVEFLPANWAYELVGLQGFRTFCLIGDEFYEPFSTFGAEPNGDRKLMRIDPDRLQLSTANARYGLQFDVEYFSPAEQPLGALVRHVRITNLADAPTQMTLLDGLPLILPAGVADFTLKAQRHITAAYAYVRPLACGAPYFATKVAVHDEAEVAEVTRGNFYAAWRIDGAHLRMLEPIVDPQVVFGAGQNFVSPRVFIEQRGVARHRQVWENRLGCALAPLEIKLEPGETAEFAALIGAAPSAGMANRFIASFTAPAEFARERASSERTIAAVTTPALTVSNRPTLDAYSRMNFLDNVLRGGLPVALPSKGGPTLLHVFARRHGDLERDYNFFVLPPHPLSSGAGNYRDICQNRRCDVLFYPDVRDRELRMFLTLLRADGYNPLAIEGFHWVADETQVDAFAPDDIAPNQLAELRRMVTKPFQPGALLHWLDCHDIRVANRTTWLHQLLSQCETKLIAGNHEGGYWIDHWTYLVDLLEALDSVYPDELVSMLTEDADVGWFDDGALVQPRSAKYCERPQGLRQLNAIVDHAPRANVLPPVTPLAKLIALVAIKAVSFDANRRGIEMEAGRPGWNDAMNGLPSLFGSSMCESLALGRLAGWLHARFEAAPDIALPRPVAELAARAVAHLADPNYDWRAECATREWYRDALVRDAEAPLSTISGAAIGQLLGLTVQRVNDAAKRATDTNTGLTHTYFQNAPSDAPTNPADAAPTESAPLPLFLEGQVHKLRLVRDRHEARRIYTAVRDSALFDAALQMYKLNAPLKACSPDIGRARTFTPGWFENESVWLHMSYKYLLELLRGGLYDEFFRDAATMLVPFMDPRIYGRSVLENSSFIGSTANPDPASHGRGFIARLSGSTAEFIHMWSLLTMGPRPFRLNANAALEFALEPTLPGEWFTTAETSVAWRDGQQTIPPDAFGCALLGHTLLVYHNAARCATYGPQAVRPTQYQLDDAAPVNAPRLGAADAKRIRDRQVTRLDVWLA